MPYYSWQNFVADNVKAALAADAAVAIWARTVEIRNPASAPPPDFPSDLEQADAQYVLVSTDGQGADTMIAAGEYGVPVRVQVQVIVHTPFTHLQGTSTAPGDAGGYRTLGYIVSECQRVLRDQLGLTYTDQADATIQRQVMVEVLETTPIALYDADPNWIQQTISATFTVIGD